MAGKPLRTAGRSRPLPDAGLLRERPAGGGASFPFNYSCSSDPNLYLYIYTMVTRILRKEQIYFIVFFAL